MRWKLYYHDGTTFSQGNGDWLDAPPLGVVGLEYEDESVGRSRDSNDFYIFPEWGHPWGADHWGVLDYLVTFGHLEADQAMTELSLNQLADAGVKLGRSVSNEDWQAFMRWMDKDEDLPPKTAWYRYERR